MKFKKTCFECGAKVNILYAGKCEECFKELNPPIQEVKPINMKYCNSCKKINYNNQFLTVEEIDKMLVNIVKKHIVIDEHYELNDLNVTNFTVNGNKVNFDINVDCNLK